MKVLIVGGGGREHAIAWKVKQSIKVKEIFCTPGNAGTSAFCKPVAVASDDYLGLANFAKEQGIDLTIVGPEVPLCGGIVNEFHKHGLRIFGPDAKGAQLEGSKVFAKEFMIKYGIPTAGYKLFSDADAAVEYVRAKGAPMVIKADGLAAGKGVTVCSTVAEAEAAIEESLGSLRFGEAGAKIIVEDMLEGEEASILALVDGKTILALESSQDHKRAYDNDKGPNTGGMGAYSPAPLVTAEMMQQIEEKVLQPSLKGIQAEKIDFHGVLYAGLMIKDGKINVLEFNVRFGDPETQAVLARLQSDMIDLCVATADGTLADFKLKWDCRPAVCVVMAAGGYPGHYHKHKVITGLEKFAETKDLVVFHAGTDNVQGEVVTNGGRVLGVTALGDDLSAAIAKAYNAVEEIHFDQAHFRWDIGAKAIK